MDEFKDVKLIAVHIHGPGMFHSKDPINKLDDLKGMKVRGGSRIINIMLEQLGATPVGMLTLVHRVLLSARPRSPGRWCRRSRCSRSSRTTPASPATRACTRRPSRWR